MDTQFKLKLVDHIEFLRWLSDELDHALHANVDEYPMDVRQEYVSRLRQITAILDAMRRP